MKISNDTVAVLKNLAAINQSIAIDAGSSRLHTVSNAEDLYASVVVPEVFPVSCSIYDLNQFISVMSLLDDPKFDFQANKVTISEGTRKIRYMYADRAAIKTPKSDVIRMPPSIVEASITSQHINELLKAAAVLQLPHIAISADLEINEVLAYVTDMRNPAHNEFCVRLTPTSEMHGGCTAVFRVDKLRVLPGTYTVSVAKGIGRFSSPDNGHGDVNYYIGCDESSKWSQA